MSDATRYVLDTPRLFSAVTTVARHRRINMREVANETGMSPSTLTRLSQGQKPDADALITLLWWLGEDVIRLFAQLRDSEQPT